MSGGTAARHAAVEAALEGSGFAVADGVAPDLVVVVTSGTAADCVRLVRAAAGRHPDSLLLAVMPGESRNSLLRRTLLAGASGLVLDDDVGRALGATARAVLAGQLAIPGALLSQVAPRPLSHREQQVLTLVAAGCTNREIADRLFLAESTVKTHLSSAFRKVDARSRAEAVARLRDPETAYGLGIPAAPLGLTAR